MKKLIAIATAAISMMLLSGCNYPSCDLQFFEDYLPEYDSGYFRYAVRTLDDGTQKAYLVGLTELGKEQTELIYPEEIEGIPVYGIGYNRDVFMGTERVGRIESDNLNKFYFPTMPQENGNSIGGYLNSNYTVRWEMSDRTNIVLDGVSSIIYGYDYLVEADLQFQSYLNRLIGNISYLNNYEGSPNEGYYWVDSYDESIVTFIPPEPQRAGYIFDGWYKEEECINRWDFEKDTTGKEIKLSSFSESTKYEITYLYAKWIEQ